MSKEPQASITEVTLDPDLVQRAEQHGHQVVILPLRRAGDKAVYSQASVLAAKDMRLAGLDAAFLDPPNERVFEGKYGDLEMAVQTLALGIASSASWDGIKTFLAVYAKQSNQYLSVTFLDLTEGDRRQTAIEAKGEPQAVIRAIEVLRSRQAPVEDGEE